MFSVYNVRQKLSTLTEIPELAIRQWPGLDLDGFQPAAVLVLLVQHDDSYKILLTKRSEKLRQHSGEVSFPGGRQDLDDKNLEFTALREAEEEVGLNPSDVSIFGHLGVMPTISNYNLSSFVGEVQGPYDFKPNPGEIDFIFEVSLEELADPSIYRRTEYDWKGTPFPMHEFHLNDQRVWGITGYMLYEFLRFLDLAPSMRL